MKLPGSPLHAICDADACDRAGWTLTDLASACLRGGAQILQVRAKFASSRWLYEAALAVLEVARPAGAVVIVNDRADIARLSAADGVHIGQEDLSPVQVRSVVGEEAIVGLSTHTVEQIGAAVQAPVSYIAIGPVFRTYTKETGYEAVGLERVRIASGAAGTRGLPVVAIGGITLERAPSVIEAGAQAVAVISDLLSTGSPEERVREYLSALSKVSPST